MRKLLFTLMALCMATLAMAQTPAQTIHFTVKSTNLEGSQTKTVKMFFPHEWGSTSNPTDGKYFTSGFYALWVKGDTTDAGNGIGATDSLTIRAFSLNYDGSIADRDSTTIVSNLDWDVETYHGPFYFLLNPSAGIAIKLIHTGVADTSKQTITIWH